jgi:hypothetical protein
MRNGGLGGSRRLGWLIAGVLSVVTAGWGLLDPGIYVGLIAPATRPGALSQDVITVIAGLTLCGLAGTRIGPKAELVGLGLLGYLFYGYGIYVIERVYNLLYLNYLALFGIAAWLLVLGAVDVVHSTADRASLPRQFSKISAGGALLQPLIFYPLWISMLIPIMVTREQIDSLYSIFILDLVFIMPAFLLVAVGQFRGRSWAVVLAPVMFLLGAVLIFSLALGELVKPAFGSPITMAGLLPPTLLTALFVALAVLHLNKLSFWPCAHPPTEPGVSSQSSVKEPASEMASGSIGSNRLSRGRPASPSSSTRPADALAEDANPPWPCTSGQAARADILVSRAVVEGPGVGQVEAVPLF